MPHVLCAEQSDHPALSFSAGTEVERMQKPSETRTAVGPPCELGAPRMWQLSFQVVVWGMKLLPGL